MTIKVKKGYASEMFYDLYGLSAKDRRDMDIKRETLWLKRLRAIGSRDPRDPAKFLPKDHPRTKAHISRRKIELDYLRDKISLKVYQNKVRALGREKYKV